MFEYAVSPRAKSDVKSQNLPSDQRVSLVRDETAGSISDISQCVSLMNAMRFASCSVASGVGGTPETKQNPSVS